jgi:hypothetical protein
MVLGKLGNNMQTNETGPLSYPIPKFSFKWIKDLNVDLTQKTPRRKCKGKVPWSWQGFFFGYHTKGSGNNSKNKQMGLYKNKRLYIVKEITNEEAAYRLGGNICKSYI